jgi:hypothetical protein
MRRAPRRHLSTDSEAVCCLGHRQRLAGCSNGTVAEPAVAATSALCYMYGCARIQKRAAGDLRSVPSRHFSFSVLVLAVHSFSLSLSAELCVGCCALQPADGASEYVARRRLLSGAPPAAGAPCAKAAASGSSVATRGITPSMLAFVCCASLLSSAVGRARRAAIA